MIDKILHSITNRNLFASSGFRSVSGFVPVEASEAAQKVRRLVGLDVTAHDYYVQGALAAIDAYPDIREAFQEGDRSYALHEFKRPLDSWGGVGPVADRHGPFYARRVPQNFPVDFNVVLSYVDLNHVTILVDGVRHEVLCSVGGGILYPEWPGIGISGGLKLVAQDWDPDFVGVVHHMPTSFPYPALAALLDLDTNKNELLLGAGLLEHYSGTREPLKKYALVLLALGKSTLP